MKIGEIIEVEGVKIPLELFKKIEQLENQIEQMMNCENCNGHSSLTCSGCKNYSNWGLKNDL